MTRLRGRLATVLAATGKRHQALQMYLRELQEDPGNIDTLFEYGELLIDMGRRPEAAEKFRRILELEPANISAHHRLGEIALADGRLDRAQVEFELVHKLDSRYPRIKLALADVLLQRGLSEEAAQHLRAELDLLRADVEADEPFVEDRPVDDDAAFAQLLLKAGMYDEAANLFERVIDRVGETPDMLRHLALARFQSGNHAGGVVISRRVIRMDPTCVSSMHNLALAALREDRLLTAAGWIRRGLRVDRYDDGLRRLRMRVWLVLGAAVGRRFWRWLQRGGRPTTPAPSSRD
jgi:tetratricopeptide (TPR) repeat protein